MKLRTYAAAPISDRLMLPLLQTLTRPQCGPGRRRLPFAAPDCADGGGMKEGGKKLRENTFVLEETINTLLDGKKYATLRDVLSTMNAADVAAIFEEIADEGLPRLFRLLPKEQAAETSWRWTRSSRSC